MITIHDIIIQNTNKNEASAAEPPKNAKLWKKSWMKKLQRKGLIGLHLTDVDNDCNGIDTNGFKLSMVVKAYYEIFEN